MEEERAVDMANHMNWHCTLSAIPTRRPITCIPPEALAHTVPLPWCARVLKSGVDLEGRESELVSGRGRPQAVPTATRRPARLMATGRPLKPALNVPAQPATHHKRF